jgi:hypothetical protein
MNHVFATAAIGLALLGSAWAQGGPPLPALPSTGGVAPVTRSQDGTLTPEQKTMIARAVKQSARKERVPPGVNAQIGAELPAALELYVLPDITLSEIPAAKLYKYTVVNDRVVLVDPTNMRVVDILPE